MQCETHLFIFFSKLYFKISVCSISVSNEGRNSYKLSTRHVMKMEGNCCSPSKNRLKNNLQGKKVKKNRKSFLRQYISIYILCEIHFLGNCSEEIDFIIIFSVSLSLFFVGMHVLNYSFLPKILNSTIT